MKRISIAATAVALSAVLALPAFAGPVGVARTYVPAQTNSATIAELQEAAKQALREGRQGNKNNPEFARKNYQINQLIGRLQAGQHVDPAEIDQALEPVQIW